MPDTSPPKLRRALGLTQLTLYGLGVTVGAGIYVLAGETAAVAGAYAPVSFLFAAIVVAFTALSYAELSTRYPVSAGEAAYVDAGLRRKSVTLLLGLMVCGSGIVSAAAVSIGAAGYLETLTGWHRDLMVPCIVVVMGLLAWWGIAQSVTFAAAITVLEIVGLALVVAWAIFAPGPLILGVSDMVPPLSGTHWAGLWAASLLAFFAFVGFEDIANVAEEVKSPRHTLPRAIALTLLVATALYLLVVGAVLMRIPVRELAGTPAPLALIFQTAPDIVQRGFAGLAVLATVNGVLIQVIMASRVLFGLADQGHLPKRLAIISPRTHTPTLATALVCALVGVFALSLPIAELAIRTSQITLGVFVLVNLSLIALKLRGKTPTNAFYVPMIVPVLGIVTSVGLFASGF